jgi:hypothetical protein
VAWAGAPPPPGTPVQLHHWNSQALVLSADGTPLGTVQAALNPTRAGLVRAQVSQNIGKDRHDLSGTRRPVRRVILLRAPKDRIRSGQAGN